MMKKLLVGLVLLLLLGNLSYGQKIYFSDTTNYWMTRHTIGGGPDPYLVSHASYRYDTTVIEWNGHSYRSLEGLLIRDDTNTRRVYAKAFQSDRINQFRILDTLNEFVYMDYSLNIGDTIKSPLIYWNDSANISIVQSIDSVLINNEWYKKMRIKINRLFESQDQWYWTGESYSLIEGIGFEHGPLIDIRGNGEWSAPTLICFTNQGVAPYSLLSDCNPNPISISETERKSIDFQLFPNPASGNIKLSYRGENNSVLQVFVTDLLGKTRLQTTFKQEAVIDVSHLTAGIYFVRILNKDALLQTKKLVIVR